VIKPAINKDVITQRVDNRVSVKMRAI